MPIVFAENFQNDDPSSFLQRYPGSQRTAVHVAKAWPLRQGTADPAGDQILVLPIEEYSDRVELAFVLESDGTTDNLATEASLFLLGGIEIKSSASGTAISVNGGTAYQLSGGSYRTAEGTVQQWNITYDRTTQVLRVVLKGSILALEQTLTEDPVWVPTIVFSCDTENGQPPTLNSLLTQLVIANDNAPLTIMTNIDFQDLALTVNADGGWTFSNVGLLEDTDKDNGSDEEPSISSGPDDLQISVSGVDNEFVNVYVAGRQEGDDHVLHIEGLLTSSFDIEPEQTAVPIVQGTATGSLLILRSSPLVPAGIE